MPPKTAARGEYIETDTGNKISRRALLHGTPHIVLAGKSVIEHDVVIRGDLVKPAPSTAGASSSTPTTTTDTSSKAPTSSTKPISIHLGRYVHIAPHTTLLPPSHNTTHHPLRIGDFVSIGPHCVLNCAQIGQYVQIGKDCVLGNMCIVKDNVRVLEGSVLPAGSVWASGCVVGGRPARVVGEVGEGWGGVEGGAGPGGRAREVWAGVGAGAKKGV